MRPEVLQGAFQVVASFYSQMVSGGDDEFSEVPGFVFLRFNATETQSRRPLSNEAHFYMGPTFFKALEA